MWEYIDSLLKLIQSNPIAASIFGASTVTGLLLWARNIPNMIFHMIYCRITQSLVLSSKDFEYEIRFIQKYIDKIYYSPSNQFSLVQDYSEDTPPALTVGENNVVWCKLFNKLCIVKKSVEGKSSSANANQSFIDPIYNYTFTIFAFRKETLLNWFKAIYDYHREQESHSDKLKVIIPSNEIFGTSYIWKNSICLDTLVLSSNIKTLSHHLINRLTNKNDFFISKNIPNKEGLLLYGVPGCGKSLFIQALAFKYNYSILYLNLNAIENEKQLYTMMSRVLEKRCIILIEDIDCQMNACVNRDEQDKDSKLSLSFILNLLDGILTQPGQFVAVTTNNINALDPALIRDGRFNTKIEFKPFDVNQVAEYLSFFYTKDTYTHNIKEHLKDIHGTITPAKLTSICVRYSDYPTDEFIQELITALKGE